MFNTYNRIDTLDKLKDLDTFLMLGDKPKYQLLAYDTETNGLNLYKTTLIGFSISISRYQGFYIPFLEWIPDETSLKERSIDKVKYKSYMTGNLRCVWTGEIYPEFVLPENYSIPSFIVDYMKRWLTNTNLIMLNAPFDTNHTYINTGIDLKDNIFADIGLMSHIINENSSNALKRLAEEYKNELGINPYVAANIEQQELIKSIIENGGAKSEVWRSGSNYQSKYACKDTMLTFGLYEVLLQKFIEEFGEEGLDWIFNDEVMPLCREVVIPMKRKGVLINEDHFKVLEKETKAKMIEIEDEIINTIKDNIYDFPIPKSDKISDKAFNLKILELEGLEIPTKYDKKTDTYKESFAKATLKEAYQENPHWVWSYLLGEDELKYSDEKVKEIKESLYLSKKERRYVFNIQSNKHLTWLFCDKFGVAKNSLPQTDSATKDNPIPSLEAEVLEEHLLPRFPWIKKLLTYKKLLKLYSSYILPAIELNIKGWLFVDWKQNGTVSGRFSCSGGFNLQTLPKVEDDDNFCSKCKSENIEHVEVIQILGIRRCLDCGFEEDMIQPSAIKKGFIAPENKKIINSDFSSLEPRCFSFMSGDAKLKDIYLKNLDMYSKVYCDTFNEWDKYSANPKDSNFLKKLNPQLRTMTKPWVLGIPYGAKAGQVARLTNNLDENGKPNYAKGQEIIDRYLSAYLDLKQYMYNKEIEALEKGYVRSLIGRRRHFQYIHIFCKEILCKHINKDNEESSDMRHSLLSAFLEVPNSKLREKEVDCSKNNIKIKLTEQNLKDFVKLTKLDYRKVREKGTWEYIKNLIKNEFNNAKNFPIQALAGHITNKAMLEVTRYLKQCNLDQDCYVFIQVHDEIGIYAPENVAKDVLVLLKEAMTSNKYTDLLDIPIEADPVICDNLKESK